MGTVDLTRYGITGTKELIYNPSYERLFEYIQKLNPAAKPEIIGRFIG